MSTEREKSEKSKITNQMKHVPKDAQVIMSILKELGVQDYEPRVINQLLEFTYRYVTCILDDAKVFANHAKKKAIDLDDVKLATEMVLDKAFTSPPHRYVLVKLAEVKNSMPLPPIKPHCGLRLPPDRYCLSACNYKLRATAPPKKMTKSAIESRSTIKTQIKSQANPGMATGIKRQQTSAASKTQVIAIPKPHFKFTTPKSSTGEGSSSKTVKIEEKMEIDDDGNSVKPTITTSSGTAGSIVIGVKREREDDDFDMVT